MRENEPDSETNGAEVAPGVHCVWVLAGGPISELPSALRWVPPADRVVAADGGSALALRLGVKPDLVIGDLDSIAPEVLAELQAAGTQFDKYEHNTKAETDTELAMLAALRWRPERIVVLGAIGGRLDHAIANVMLLTHPALSEQDVTLIEGNHEAFLAKPGRWNEVRGQVGDLLSLLPIGEDALGVRTEGLMYPLEGETLPYGRGRGVSNELLEIMARVWLDAGKLLIVVSHQKSD